MLNPFDSLSPAAGLALYGLGLTTLAAVICGLSLALLLQTGWASRLALDHPNARSLHEEVVPRCGGWGILGTLLVILAATSPSLWRLIAALCVLVVVSFLDDRQGMPILLRFGAQVLAVLVVLSGYPQTLPWWVLAVSALAWLWGTNLYNFMDGADMMAGTMTVTGFAAYAAASATDNVSLTTVCLGASGSALGFLWFNRPPARLFLGDVGSIPLGFLAGAMGFWGWRDGRWPYWFPFLVFSPFVADATVTLLRRLLRREKIWQAHREHYYQRLIQSGFSHARTTGIWAGAMLLAALLGLLLLRSTPLWQGIGIAAWCVALALVGAGIDLRWMRQANAGSQSGSQSEDEA